MKRRLARLPRKIEDPLVAKILVVHHLKAGECNKVSLTQPPRLNDHFNMTAHTYEDDDDDDIPKLPGDTIAALQEFYTERELSAKRFEELKTGSEERPQILSMNMFMEDWNASQFWVSFSSSGVSIGRGTEG